MKTSREYEKYWNSICKEMKKSPEDFIKRHKVLHEFAKLILPIEKKRRCNNENL